MIATLLHDVFHIIKFLFGLGALFGLLGITVLCLWFLGRFLMRHLLRGHVAQSAIALRKIFLEP